MKYRTAGITARCRISKRGHAHDGRRDLAARRRCGLYGGRFLGVEAPILHRRDCHAAGQGDVADCLASDHRYQGAGDHRRVRDAAAHEVPHSLAYLDEHLDNPRAMQRAAIDEQEEHRLGRKRHPPEDAARRSHAGQIAEHYCRRHFDVPEHAGQIVAPEEIGDANRAPNRELPAPGEIRGPEHDEDEQCSDGNVHRGEPGLDHFEPLVFDVQINGDDQHGEQQGRERGAIACSPKCAGLHPAAGRSEHNQRKHETKMDRVMPRGSVRDGPHDQEVVGGGDQRDSQGHAVEGASQRLTGQTAHRVLLSRRPDRLA
jgi:hypothetical protein